jgi:predicted AAA+ superfamily ATPase
MITNFLKIKDNFLKYLLTMDDNFRDNYQGIQAIPIHEFLLLDN